MDSDSDTSPGHYLVRRELLIPALAAPFAGLIGAFLLAWPWRAFELPGTAGSLTPPSIALLGSVAFGGAFAIRHRLPLGLITWPPGALGAIVLLTTGFISREFDPLAGVVALVSYGLIYLLVLLVSISLMDKGVHLAISYASFFILTQALRFPVFEAAGGIENATALTAVAALRSLGEASAGIWLAHRLVTASEGSGAGVARWLVLLVACHGILACWEGPLLAGTLSFATAGAQVLRWLGLVLVQVGLIFALSRIRRAFTHFAVVEYVRQKDGPPNASSSSAGTRRQGPTPRSRRRR